MLGLFTFDEARNCAATRHTLTRQNQVTLLHTPAEVRDGGGFSTMNAPHVGQNLLLERRWNSVPHRLRLARKLAAHLNSFIRIEKGERCHKEVRRS